MSPQKISRHLLLVSFEQPTKEGVSTEGLVLLVLSKDLKSIEETAGPQERLKEHR